METDDEFSKLLLQGVREFPEHQKPVASIYVHRDGKALEVTLDNSASSYNEWIRDEGADIGLDRDRDTNKVVGARLPLYAKTLIIGGDVFESMEFDLETGERRRQHDELNRGCIFKVARLLANRGLREFAELVGIEPGRYHHIETTGQCTDSELLKIHAGLTRRRNES